MDENRLVGTAIQCWTAMEEFFGIVPCAVMSMMSDILMPSACEVDVTGAVGMYALQLAAGTPSALADWNNNYGDDPDKAVLFHCSNLPKSFFESVEMGYQAIIAGTVGRENAYGSMSGRIKAGPFSYCRVSTDDSTGTIRAYVGEGRITDDPLETFGGYGVVEIPGMQRLLRYICENGFEHHVAISKSMVGEAVAEALAATDGVEFAKDKNTLRLEVRRLLEELLKAEKKIDLEARRKIESQKRTILEGSQEWDILYRKYYNEEVKKLGI
jgi:L-fucose isomerase-like protein